MKEEKQPYFEHSQAIRREIEQSPHLLEQIKKTFTGRGDRIAETSDTGIFRVGKLKSGLYVALRKDYITYSLGICMIFLENYCQNAERLFNQGKNVPDFCVGITLDERIGILTEDLTDNGRNTLSDLDNDSERARFLLTKPNGETKEVYVDIDAKWHLDSSIHGDNLRYFKEGNYIELME